MLVQGTRVVEIGTGTLIRQQISKNENSCGERRMLEQWAIAGTGTGTGTEWLGEEMSLSITGAKFA